MFDYPYLIELLTPKRPPEARATAALDRFAARFAAVVQAGCGVSIPDNPMGQPRLGALETIEQTGLVFDPEHLLMNLNTFHDKEDLDRILSRAIRMGLRYILVVRGDGGPLLPRLDPHSIGGSLNVATSADLLRHINSRYPGVFVTGAAFNQFKRPDIELRRAREKVAAGARFIVTQPIVGHDPVVARLSELEVPVIPEAWMSERIELLNRSVGRADDEAAEPFDPVANLDLIHRDFGRRCVYLSMLRFADDWAAALPRLAGGG